MRIGQKFTWGYKGVRYTSTVETLCRKCGACAVVALSGALLAEQTDGTTHVCHPSVGGCNEGYANDGPKLSPEKQVFLDALIMGTQDRHGRIDGDLFALAVMLAPQFTADERDAILAYVGPKFTAALEAHLSR